MVEMRWLGWGGGLGGGEGGVEWWGGGRGMLEGVN